MKITETQLFLNSLYAFISFSLAASAIYIYNDYNDIDDDKLHPKKKYRPLASGAITISQAIALIGLLISSAFLIAFTFTPEAIPILAAYILMNILYCVWLKHVAIIDITIIAVGFVLRLFIGSAVTDTPLSMWIVVMTFMLALFMALAKRRDDVLIFNLTGKKMRKVVDGYNIDFLNMSMAIIASVIIVAYTIYTTTAAAIARVGSQHLYITTIFVVIGIMRYLQITFVLEESGSPTHILLKDRFLQITLLGWIATFGWLLYLCS
jgi:4-hydroxybenzoate polyprenyltransferase